MTYLLNFLNLLVKTTNHVISGVRNLLNFHKVNQGINFTWQDKVENIAIITEGNSCRWGKFSYVYTFVNINNILPLWMNLENGSFSFFTDSYDVSIRLQQH